MSHGLHIRGDSLYCPLSFSLDAYNDCQIDCWHCYCRRLNYVWKRDFAPNDPEDLRRKLTNGLKNPQPKSSIAYAIKQKKTIRLGDKNDPFQPAELKYRTTKRMIDVLIDLRWNYVIQTQCTHLLMEYEDQLCNTANPAIILPTISPGAESDWEILERKRTTPIPDRFEHMKILMKSKKYGLQVGVNGEPFIPGYHTIKQFEDIIKRLKSAGIKSYNVYNLHANDFVFKRLAAIGINIETIWRENQDQGWRPIQRKLCDIALKYNIVLGCPDFVNVGRAWINRSNTCCGIDVMNPSTYNTHTWRELVRSGKSAGEIVEKTWDGIGNRDEGMKILSGKSKKMYTMADAGLIVGEKEGLLF